MRKNFEERLLEATKNCRHDMHEPGIGRGWFDKFKSDVFPFDSIVIRGKKCKVPKYYSRCYEVSDFSDYQDVRAVRVERARGDVNNLPERLEVRENIQQDRFKRLKRSFESSQI